MLAVLGFSALVFFLYVLFLWSTFGVLPSISDGYYSLDKPDRWWPSVIFPLFSIPMMIVGSTGLMFFAGVGICFVGAAPMFREGMEGKVHSVGAMGGIVLGMASMWINFHFWWIPVIFIIGSGLIYYFDKKTHTWWIEILAFFLIFLGLVITNWKG